MAAHLGRAPLASPPAPALGAGAAVARILLLVPHNMRSDGVLHHSSAGARFTSASSVGCQSPFAMAEDADDAVFLFAAARGNLSDILTVENGGPRLVEPEEDQSTTVAQDTFSVTV